MKLKVISSKINQFFLILLNNINIKLINQIIQFTINFKMSNTFHSNFKHRKREFMAKAVPFINSKQNSLFKVHQAFLKIIPTLNSKELF